jgi:hypothetical protein
MVSRWLWITAIQRDWPLQVLSEAISAVPLELARWFFDHGPPELTISLDGAAAHGDLEFIRWAHGQGAVASTDAMDNAATNNALPILRRFHANRGEGCTTEAMNGAAGGGFVDVLDWLWNNRPAVGCTGRAVILAARGGHLRALECLMTRYPHFYTAAAFDHAAGAGHLLLLQWLTSRSSASTNAMDWAAAGGRLDVVIWLHECCALAARQSSGRVYRCGHGCSCGIWQFDARAMAS